MTLVTYIVFLAAAPRDGAELVVTSRAEKGQRQAQLEPYHQATGRNQAAERPEQQGAADAPGATGNQRWNDKDAGACERESHWRGARGSHLRRGGQPWTGRAPPTVVEPCRSRHQLRNGPGMVRNWPPHLSPKPPLSFNSTSRGPPPAPRLGQPRGGLRLMRTTSSSLRRVRLLRDSAVALPC